MLDYRVEIIPKEKGKEWIKEKHYAQHRNKQRFNVALWSVRSRFNGLFLN